MDFSWESISEYLDAIGRNRGINVGALVGHSSIRRYIMGEACDERQATPEEIEAMKGLVRDGMLAGALGFSIANFDDHGLEFFNVIVPSSVAGEAEWYALGSVLGELGTGVSQVSGGALGDFLGPARIAQELSSRTGRPAMYNLLTQELNNPGQWKEALAMVRRSLQVRRQGLCLVRIFYRGTDLRLEVGTGWSGGRGHDQPFDGVPGYADLGLSYGPAD